MTHVADEVPLTLEGKPPKTLGVLDQGALWANLGVSLLGFSGALYLLNPLGNAPLSLIAALTATVVGSLIGTSMVGLSAIPGTQTGQPSMVLLRGLFGAKTSYVPTVLNIVQMLGWGAFELWVIAKAATAIFGGVPYQVWVIAAGVLTTALTIWPLGAVRLIRRYVTIGVIVSMIWFTWFLVSEAPAHTGGSWTAFPAAVDYVIALSVSWVPMAADFARHSRSSRAAFTGVVGGYTLAQVACLGLGVYAVAIAGADAVLADATAVFSPFVAVPLGAVFFAILVLRETDQSFANVYSTTVSLQNLMPRVDRRIFSTAIGVLTVAIALVVDVTSYGAFLGVIGAVFVPMFAVLAVDYFVFARSDHWNTAEDAPSRWSMLVPWVLGFAAYWLTTSTPTVPAWDDFWTRARVVIGFTREAWMNGALGGALVAALVTLLIGWLTRVSRR
ncbi:purine-cytosine permease family protein [Nonomuraea basaltis]|uniref:purine-cytosine permease family protein n=1 Tax=Nonomuraea basaltis TaxID=2495887 RepID=UPI00110C592A|nr:cytosine permease [Nonomuraea basaltis]TMR99416.1 allantoin permease [Nonomuraea basaltis]